MCGELWGRGEIAPKNGSGVWGRPYVAFGVGDGWQGQASVACPYDAYALSEATTSSPSVMTGLTSW
jgi:hypothetical protein